MNIQRLRGNASDFSRTLKQLLESSRPTTELIATVTGILEQVRQRGDEAVLEYTSRFDRHTLTADQMEIPASRVQEALNSLPPALRKVLEQAATRISRFHEKQKQDSWQYKDEDTGATLGERVTAVERAGIYAPGGTAAYPSSVLMSAVPARLAGVNEVIMTVPAPNGDYNPVTLAAASIAGVDRIYAIGGAQAIAALAYGTETIPRVDVITGPGNRYVAMAKKLVFGQVGIDMLAGPSEVLIIADSEARPEWLAADLCAQAEHDEDARTTLISTDAALLDATEKQLEKIIPALSRADIIRKSLDSNGLFIHVEDMEAAVAVANEIAPEHLQLAVTNPEALLAKIKNAGAIFLGHACAEVYGDYCAGPNHVLPTGGTSRFSSPLSLRTFQKRSSIIQCDIPAARAMGEIAIPIAEQEGLTAHALAAQMRSDRDDHA